MFGFCSDFSEVKDTLSFTLSLAVCRHGYDGTGEGGIRTLGTFAHNRSLRFTSENKRVETTWKRT
jgi:hypothetical protein